MAVVGLTVKQIRLRGGWLLVPPFFYFSKPTPTTLAAGGVLIIVGLIIRAWAAGVIHKDQALSTTGPYAYTRNPLYLGTFFLGLGGVVAAGQPLYLIVFIPLFAWIYGSSMREEAGRLGKMFGDDYAAFAEAVPLFMPRLTPARLEGAAAGFDGSRWKKNREYEALLGAALCWGALVVRMVWFG